MAQKRVIMPRSSNRSGRAAPACANSTIKAPISCVFRKRTPASESRAFKIFSAACWQWNPMISSLIRSEVSTSSSRASSWAALRSNSTACSRCFIQDFAFGGRLEINIPRRVAPVIEFLRAHHQQIHRDVKRTQQPIQPHHLPGTIRNTILDYHDVEVAVFTRLAARLRTEHNDALGLGGLNEQLCQPLDGLGVPGRGVRVQT